MMMDDETNEIEIDFVELLLEEVFTDNANPEMVSALVPRAKALTLLEEDPGDASKRTFPHETVRSYFFRTKHIRLLSCARCHDRPASCPLGRRRLSHLQPVCPPEVAG